MHNDRENNTQTVRESDTVVTIQKCLTDKQNDSIKGLCNNNNRQAKKLEKKKKKKKNKADRGAYSA